ncbi:hypothetical protein JCM3765_006843 [Sporobolomyces pararoseus]
MTWTRLIRFVAKEDGKTYYGDCITKGDIGLLYFENKLIQAHPLNLSVNENLNRSASSLLPLSPFNDSSDFKIDPSKTLTVLKLLPPLDPTSITTIRGLGLQYAPPGSSNVSHPPPPVPCLFLKPPSTLSGPNQEIVIPSIAKGEKNDYEVELCVIIGSRDLPKNTNEKDVMKYVGGFTVVNDVSSRGLCGKGGAGQWGMGKNYDSWCPIGPCIVKPSSLSNPHSLDFNTKLNNKLVQKGNTSQLLLSVPKLLATLCQGSTLSAHSLILTGSPIAIGRNLPTDSNEQSPFLKNGDLVKCWIQGIGTLVNTVREENESETTSQIYKAKL